MSELHITTKLSDTSEGIDEIVEPKLKYKRMGNNLNEILSTDTVSCIAVHPKFICIGTHRGFLHLLDHEGFPSDGKKFKAHTVSINQISIDSKGEYLATCSDDGKVFIHELCSIENNQYYNIGRLIKSVAIDPFYYKTNGRRFVTGDDKLTLHERTFLGLLRSTILCERSEGFVRNMAWNEHFIAWSSDIGVRVFDVNASCSLGVIKWEEHPDLAKFRCNLRWSDSRTLLIGWVDIVRVCVIRKRSVVEVAQKNLPDFLVDPVSTFKVDFYISGIAPLDHLLVLLGFPKDRDEQGKSFRPQLFVLEFNDNDYTEICTDFLKVREYKDYSVNEYHLDVLIEENRFFIVAPKDIVVANQYDLDDRIQWLKNHGKYEEGLQVLMKCKKGESRLFNVVNFGIEYIDFLLMHKQYDQAGKLCQKIFNGNKALWEVHIYKFFNINQLRSVSSYIPLNDEDKLEKHIYEIILYEYLKIDPRGFLRLVKEWKPTLYNPNAVINAVLDQLKSSDREKKVFQESLALLYSYEKQYDMSLKTYLALQNKDVFMLIAKHELYGVISEMIVELMNLDVDKAIELLLQKNAAGHIRIPSDTVVQKLCKYDNLLHKYLDAYDKIDAKNRYHGQLVRLYATFERNKLLPLLKRSENYPIQAAIDICEREKYYPELVFLLARIGDFKEALEMIMTQLRDIQLAIAFCQEQNDRELWNQLIDYSIETPDFITYLLHSLGTYMDPTELIEKIDDKKEIAGLKQALIKMLCAYNLHVRVQQGCKKILVADYFNLHRRLVRMQCRGLHVDDETVCAGCHRTHHRNNEIYLFNCKHLFHKGCLSQLETCPICHKATQST